MPTETVKVSTELSKQQHSKLKELAESRGTKISAIIGHAIKQLLIDIAAGADLPKLPKDGRRA